MYSRQEFTIILPGNVTFFRTCKPLYRVIELALSLLKCFRNRVLCYTLAQVFASQNLKAEVPWWCEKSDTLKFGIRNKNLKMLTLTCFLFHFTWLDSLFSTTCQDGQSALFSHQENIFGDSCMKQDIINNEDQKTTTIDHPDKL
jgi:hypothetical protein